MEGIKLADRSINTGAADLVEKVHSLWTEKYRPTTVDELAADQEVKNFLVEVIRKQDIPNMLLHGRPGTGKNSIVNVILNNIRCSKLVINASEERGIDTIRDKVLAFATSAAWGNTLKIVVLNEADGLNYTAQDSLRELMETSSKYCRFILTCNSINRINDAIRSRCAEFETHIEPIDAAKRLVEILDNEEIN
jgi:DNA polymerase III delta prime subunit